LASKPVWRRIRGRVLGIIGLVGLRHREDLLWRAGKPDQPRMELGDVRLEHTLLKHEPSAQIPWQNTMLGLVCVGIVRSSAMERQRCLGERSHHSR
jgi:hypothetical protein